MRSKYIRFAEKMKINHNSQITLQNKDISIYRN